jgi:hypothetical protein
VTKIIHLLDARAAAVRIAAPQTPADTLSDPKAMIPKENAVAHFFSTLMRMP